MKLGYYQQTLIPQKPSQYATSNGTQNRRHGSQSPKDMSRSNGGINAIVAFFDRGLIRASDGPYAWIPRPSS